MTTFQYLVDAFLSTLALILPLPRILVESIHRENLQWGDLSPSLLLLVTTTGTLYLLYLFRYDFLGVLSALLRSLTQPASLKAESRTLDQQILLFLVIVFGFFSTITSQLALFVREMEWTQWNPVRAAALVVLAFGFRFSKNWNKRIKGLNHLRIADAFGIGVLLLFAAIPGLNWLGLLWIGFALLNYHYEAVFKYSAILLTLKLSVTSLELLQTQSFLDAMKSVGILNAIAAIVIAWTTLYLVLEHLQKTMSENTLKSAMGWSLLFSLYFGVMSFL